MRKSLFAPINSASSRISHADEQGGERTIAGAFRSVERCCNAIGVHARNAIGGAGCQSAAGAVGGRHAASCFLAALLAAVFAGQGCIPRKYATGPPWPKDRLGSLPPRQASPFRQLRPVFLNP